MTQWTIARQPVRQPRDTLPHRLRRAYLVEQRTARRETVGAGAAAHHDRLETCIAHELLGHAQRLRVIACDRHRHRLAGMVAFAGEGSRRHEIEGAYHPGRRAGIARS